jgi:hypothetical protein
MRPTGELFKRFVTELQKTFDGMKIDKLFTFKRLLEESESESTNKDKEFNKEKRP